MFFADLDANGWAIIIGAIGMVISQVVQMVLSYMRDKQAAVKLRVIEKQTNGDMVTKTAEVAAKVVMQTADKTANQLIQTATVAATTAATTAATAAATAAVNPMVEPYTRQKI